MLFYICMAAAVAITISVIVWKIRNKDVSGRDGLTVRTFLALALVDTCILYIPWFRYLWQSGEESFKNILVFIPYMIIRLLQTVSMDADYESALEIATLAKQTGVSRSFLEFYAVVLSYVSVTVPLTGVLTILSFFGNQIGSRFAMSRFSLKNRVYVFNGVGERNLELARSIWIRNGSQKNDCTYLFCNVREDPSAEAVRMIRKLGGWYTADYPSALLRIVSASKRKEMYYFLLDDEQRNFKDATNILKEAGTRSGGAKWSEAGRVEIAMVLRSNELSSIIDTQDRHGIFVRIIDIEKMCAQDLLSRWPLYTCLGDGHDVMDLMIIGSGGVAEEVLLCAVWMGQLSSASLRIRFISEKADAIRNKLIMTCPALFDPALAGGQKYDIEFENVTEEVDLELQNRSFENTDYIVVASDSDSYNIQTAMWIRTWAARDRRIDAIQPFIAVYVKDGRRAEQAELLCVQESKEISYNLHVFGTDTWLFNAEHLLDSSIVRIAHRVQMSYELRNPEDKISEELSCKAREELNQSVYRYNSSEAGALYIGCRLFDSGAVLECMRRNTDSPDIDFTGAEQSFFLKDAIRVKQIGGDSRLIDEIVDIYNEKISDPETLDRLCETEHHRWTAYMAGNGWVELPPQEMAECIRMNGGHKDYIRLRHPCMAAWEDLDELSLIRTEGKDIDLFKDLDRLMVRGVRFFIS